MAKYVIDTHALVWLLSNPVRLGHEARKAFRDEKSEFYIVNYVFEEIRRKYEKYKRDNINKGAIKIPPIICWVISKKCKNVRTYKLSQGEIKNWSNKFKMSSELKKISKDDWPIVIMYLILKQRYPRAEIKIISDDNYIRSNSSVRTCW